MLVMQSSRTGCRRLGPQKRKHRPRPSQGDGAAEEKGRSRGLDVDGKGHGRESTAHGLAKVAALQKKKADPGDWM
ncbi:hypothetical protein COP2_024479 [Malus domestica]